MELTYLEDYWSCADGLSAVNVIGTQVAQPDKIGTDPMTYDGINKWTSPRKSRGIPQVSTRFSLNVDNEQTDAGQGGQTCLATPNSQARTGTGKYGLSLFS